MCRASCPGVGLPVMLFGAIHGIPFSHLSRTTPLLSLLLFLLITSTLILLQSIMSWQLQPRLVATLIPAYVAVCVACILMVQGTLGDITSVFLANTC